MKVIPTIAETLAHAGDATHMALSVEILADTDTPISLYEKLAENEPVSFLLESAEGGENFGRYSFIGFAPSTTFSFAGRRGVVRRGDATEDVPVDDPLTILAELLGQRRVAPRRDLPRFSGGAVGWLGYAGVRYFEDVPVPGREGERESSTELDGFFAIADRVVIVDHLKHRVLLVDHIPLDGDRSAAYAAAVTRFQDVLERITRPLPPSAPFSPSDVEDAPPLSITPSMGKEAYMAAVEAGKAAIAAGEIFQIVLSQRFTVASDAPPFAIYRALRALNPSPYMFHLAFEGQAIVGASPEVLVRVDDGEILLRPIAGTRKRGATREEDAELERDLSADAKELAEHHMLLDLGRNDVGRVAEIGTVHVERPLHVERYSHVMHLVSDVRGRLAPGKSAFDVLRACFPAGTVSGAPKIRAMELIGELERTPRGLYSGTVGYFDFSGNMDTCIAIRSMVVEPGRVLVQAGAGIVYDSVPEAENEECLNKARSSFAAIALANARHGSMTLTLPTEDLPTNPIAAVARAPHFAEQEDPTDELSTQEIED